ncbi:MAG: DUF1566 domain-containing protein [Planctomycetes bacterium]|nr:DUF1566 domain-containing protein [Planctomycetota bacterium]
MKKTPAILVAFCHGVVLGWLFDRVGSPAEAEGGEEECAAENGDVNADGTVDLSDAVTILGHLFVGNPTELVRLCTKATARSGLPDTGQTLCYDTEGNIIDCESGAWPGQDGLYATGCPPEGRFVDNGDGTVTDACTGLMWLQATFDTGGDGRATTDDMRTWQEALQFCEGLQFAGSSDWRLPNVRELWSIIDHESRYPGPSIDPIFEAQPHQYWTSTSLAVVESGSAITAAFYESSQLYLASKRSSAFVRAVRSTCTAQNGDVNADRAVDVSDAIATLGHLFLGEPSQLAPLCPARSGLPDTGQTSCYDSDGDVIDCESDAWPGQDAFYATGCPSEDRFIDNRDGTVTDTCTGLMWQGATADVDGDGEVTPPSGRWPPEPEDLASDGVTWQEALEYCEELELAGYADWRLPNGNELESIVDYGRRDPCIDPAFRAESSKYWTSTSLVPGTVREDLPEAAGFVSFWYGSYLYHATKNRVFLVRAVRGAP